MPKVNGFRMRSWFLVGVVMMGFASCTNDGGTTQQKIDSLEQKIDTTLEKAADSINVKAKELKERIKDKWDDRKDSAGKQDFLKKDSTVKQ